METWPKMAKNMVGKNKMPKRFFAFRTVSGPQNVGTPQNAGFNLELHCSCNRDTWWVK